MHWFGQACLLYDVVCDLSELIGCVLCILLSTSVWCVIFHSLSSPFISSLLLLPITLYSSTLPSPAFLCTCFFYFSSVFLHYFFSLLLLSLLSLSRRQKTCLCSRLLWTQFFSFSFWLQFRTLQLPFDETFENNGSKSKSLVTPRIMLFWLARRRWRGGKEEVKETWGRRESRGGWKKVVVVKIGSGKGWRRQ